MDDLTAIKEALSTPRIKDIKPVELYNQLVTSIGFVFALKSTETDPDKVQFMARELAKAVLVRFPGLSIGEIGISLDKGVKRDYGDYFGLNVVTFLDWIRSYYYSAERKEALAQKKVLALPPVSAPSSETLERRRRGNACLTFEKFRQSKCLIGDPTFLYAYLEDKGIIDLSRSEKLEIYEEAKRKVTGMKSNERIETRSDKITNQAIDSYDDIVRFRIGNDFKSRAVAEAKRISIVRLFNRLISENTTINDLLQ